MRLGAVTQISTPDPLRPVVHNRLTHSLKVSQIARNIAASLICRAQADEELRKLILKLGGLDASVAEAAALAHDIGHPPFGHAGEKVLDDFTQVEQSPIPVDDGFEGNAQSFRFAVKADPMYEYSCGLDLTAATNAAILKYPWPRPTPELPAPPDIPVGQASLRQKKFGYYYSESEEYVEVRNWLPPGFNDEAHPRQTLEASIMDISDDITYAVHDYEDFLSMGALNPDTVTADLRALLAAKDSEERTQRDAMSSLVAELKAYDKFEFAVLKDVARDHLAQLPSLMLEASFMRAFRNSLLDELLGGSAIAVWADPRGHVGAHVGLNLRAWHLVELLKFFVKHYVINSPNLALLQAGQGALLRKGVLRFVRWHDSDSARLPGELRDRLRWAAANRESPARAYLDYVCTLGDDQFEAITLGMSGERTTRLSGGSLLG